MTISGLQTALLLALVMIYLSVFGLSFAPALRPAQGWRLAQFGAALALGLALVSCFLQWLAPTTVLPLLTPFRLGAVDLISLNLRIDALGSSVLLLVCFIAWVIVRFSVSYMAGDTGQRRYIRWLMAALAAVSGVVITNNLAVLALAWFATSLAMGRLLSFYPNRRPAAVAAHKKFLVSRCADFLLLLALGLLAWTLGTLEIDQVLLRASQHAFLPVPLQAGVILLVLAVILKCAQLPFHGWLIQVMEAPTPVSALMHAGVVNLGGFVLIRLALLLTQVPAAQTLLVVVGSATAVLAALVMMTRISIKVSLAWSTCAQMGFMLMQCGLGAFELAWLHLLAHSLYKAHAFLQAGSVVERARLQQMTGLTAVTGAASVLRSLYAAGIAISMVLLAAWLWGVALFGPPAQLALLLLTLILCLALTPLLRSVAPASGVRVWLLSLLSAFAVAWLYFGLHHLFALWLPVSVSQLGRPSGFELSWVLACFSLLFAVQTGLAAYPQGVLARRLYPWFYAGLFLDHGFSRLAFKLWPLRLKAPPTVL